MPSATLFLPRVITVLMNFATCLSPDLGSGSPSLFLTSPLRGMISPLLRLLRAVFGPALAQLRVRRLRRRRVDADANAALLRTSLQRRRGVFSPLFLASFTDELTDRGHNFTRFS